jgi:hypothetical protein
MLELKERSEKTIRREVYEFDEPYGGWDASRWTRVTVNGELSKWIPHDGYGEMAAPTQAPEDVKQTLEQIYQDSDYV